MALPLYLAMTAAEMGGNTPFPPHPGYMACHFSPYGTGLSNLPRELPPGSMLILNDRIPWCGHDSQLIAAQLVRLVEKNQCSCLLLDFQIPNVDGVAGLVKEILDTLPCPVGVSKDYCENLSCPAFLPPVPLDMPLEDYLAPWQGREVWLEAALDGVELKLKEDGCHSFPLWEHPSPENAYLDDPLHCHYHISLAPDSASFTLLRTREDLAALLEHAEKFGVTKAVGLWQELQEKNPS